MAGGESGVVACQERDCLGHFVWANEAAKDADLVIWSGDPFEPLSQPVAIFVRGAEQPMGSRQRELQRRYQQMPQGYPVQYKSGS